MYDALLEDDEVTRTRVAPKGFELTDNDGNLDIILAQNFFGSQPETGYMDGGLSLLLKGDGKRSFSAVWPKKSGIIVPDDATAAALADYDRDGDTDALIVSNQGPVRLFENKHHSDSSRIEIEVVAERSNRRAIGTLLILKTDTQTRCFEITGTSGYLGNSLSPITVPESFAKKINEAVVSWTDGSKSRFVPELQDRRITIQKPRPDQTK